MNSLNRRFFLKGAGASLLLPQFESFAKSTNNPNPKRLVIITQPMGMYAKGFHPKGNGGALVLTDPLKPLDAVKDDVTVFSNLDLSIAKGHGSADNILSDVGRDEVANFKDGGITLDARLAEHYGYETRFPYLNFWGDRFSKYSYDRTNTPLASTQKPTDAFDLLFKDTKLTKEYLSLQQQKKSILDVINKSAKSFQNKLSTADRKNLSRYFDALRQTEKELAANREWSKKPKPEGPKGFFSKSRYITERKHINPTQLNVYKTFVDMVPIIFQSDSSRVVTIEVDIGKTWPVGDVTMGYHDLTHHGQDEKRTGQLKQLDLFQIGEVSRLIQNLKDTKEANGQSLLDSTIVLYCSGLSDGNIHSNKNLPIILAGGGFKHGLHNNHKVPLSNLHLSILNQVGVKIGKFNKSTAKMKGLS